MAADAIHPPAEAVGAQRIPVVQRVAPELAVGVEIIGRHAGHGLRAAGCIHAKDPPVPPYLDAVEVHVERNVAEQAHALRVGVIPQALPLAVEQVLLEGDGAQAVAAAAEQRGQRGRVTVADRVGPFPPRLVAEAAPVVLEQRVGQEPAAVLLDKVVECCLLASTRDAAKVFVGALQPRGAIRAELLLGQPTAGDEVGGIDEAGVAGMDGLDLVGRQAAVYRPERQRLPEGEAGLRQEVHEAPRVIAEHAAGKRAGQGGRMQEHAGAAPVQGRGHGGGRLSRDSRPRRGYGSRAARGCRQAPSASQA